LARPRPSPCPTGTERTLVHPVGRRHPGDLPAESRRIVPTQTRSTNTTGRNLDTTDCRAAGLVADHQRSPGCDTPPRVRPDGHWLAWLLCQPRADGRCRVQEGEGPVE
jgi:hypothetical protein